MARLTPSVGAGDDAVFLFSPSASYPQPFACLIDRHARLVHAWSNPLDQPDPAGDPPTYLRGWNHVELGADGSLFATVPLQSLLKLAPDSTLLWRAEIPVHHDLDIGPDGRIYVLTDEPRTVDTRHGQHVILDNTVTVLDPDGRILATHSLYDVLTSHPGPRSLIDHHIKRRQAAFGVVSPGLIEPYRRHGRREALRFLRGLPGSPSDVLHANTVEVLTTHPHRLWHDGDVLVSLRTLNLIAALDLHVGQVRWWWGPGVLSGQHQPSALSGGTVLVFDNGQAAGRSRVLEVDPASGAIVWEYTATPPEALFSALAGGCQMLESGTVLITDAQAGRAIEITRGGRTLWGVQIHTTSPSTTRSRAEIYRMSAIRALTVTNLNGGSKRARRLAHRRVRCDLLDVGAVPAGVKEYQP